MRATDDARCCVSMPKNDQIDLRGVLASIRALTLLEPVSDVVRWILGSSPLIDRHDASTTDLQERSLVLPADSRRLRPSRDAVTPMMLR